MISSSGANRVTWDNFREKFAEASYIYFRFEMDDLLKLIDLLKLPRYFSLNGYKTSNIEAICVCLHRLGSQCRYYIVT